MNRVRFVAVVCALLAVRLPLMASSGWLSFRSSREEAPGTYAIDMDTGALMLLVPDEGVWAWVADGSKAAIVKSQGHNDHEIYVMDADGQNRRNVTQHPALDQQPAWSPDGSRIAFVSNREDGHAEEVFVMNADGTDVRNLTRIPRPDTQPHWAPDGKRIVFHSTRDSTDWVGIPRSAIRDEIYTMNADGSNPRRITDNVVDDDQPRWSPDGSQILYVTDLGHQMFAISIMSPDGSGSRQIIQFHRTFPGRGTWAPDGTQIAFQWHVRDPAGVLAEPDIYVMNRDGTDVRNLTDHAASDRLPDWFDPHVSTAVTPAARALFQWGWLKRVGRAR